jgi:hypothetical protein
MPANFTIPVNRRVVNLTARGSVNANHFLAVYQETGAGALVGNIIYATFTAAGGAAGAAGNVAVIGEIFRVESLIGAGAG